MRRSVALILALAAAGCGGAEPSEPAKGRAGENMAATPASPPKATPAPAPAQPHTAPWSATGYALNGTEPFWGGSVTGTTIRYMTPDDQFGDVIETRVAFAPDRETYAGSWRGSPFVLTLRRGPCSDGMSERAYAFSVALSARGEARRGCADPQ
jgi:uncharacterized membrane protein